MARAGGWKFRKQHGALWELCRTWLCNNSGMQLESSNHGEEQIKAVLLCLLWKQTEMGKRGLGKTKWEAVAQARWRRCYLGTTSSLQGKYFTLLTSQRIRNHLYDRNGILVKRNQVWGKNFKPNTNDSVPVLELLLNKFAHVYTHC